MEKLDCNIYMYIEEDLERKLSSFMTEYDVLISDGMNYILNDYFKIDKFLELKNNNEVK